VKSREILLIAVASLAAATAPAAEPEVAQVPPASQTPAPRMSTMPPPELHLPAVGQHVVAAGPRYQASALHKALLGPHYRKLWATPIRVPVLDLATFSGGLTPDEKGGGMQTRSLKFKGKDGREWRVRSVDKDPTPTLPKGLENTFVDWVLQDQISAAHPAGPDIVDTLADAAGLLHVHRRMVILPDDPRLGEFRKDFAGMLGYLEENVSLKDPVTPGFEGFTEDKGTEKLWEWLEAHPGEKVDARELLKARLFDVFIGDFDRHKDNWEWVTRGDGVWLPVPEDRDQAFVKFDGFVLAVARPFLPRIVDFETGYPYMWGLTSSGRFIDKRHLTELTWAQWQDVARELQGRLTDRVIGEAVRAQPPEYYAIDGTRMSLKLKSRRDRLQDAAREYYRLLIEDAEVHGSNGVERVEIRREGRDVEIRLTAPGATEPYFSRRFLGDETDEIRLYLRGGDDQIVTSGEGSHDLMVRVVGGPGQDALDDQAGVGVHFYDHEGESRIVKGDGTVESDRPYTHPVDRRNVPLFDSANAVVKLPWFSAGADLGAFLGAQLQYTDFGFRKHPYAHRQWIRAGYSTGLSAFRAEYEGDFLFTNSRKRWHLLARASQLDLLRFYGFGNDTAREGRDTFHHVDQRVLSFEPSFRFGLEHIDFSIGPVAKFMSTETPANRLIGQARPYGVGDFGQLGARGRLLLDGRNRATAATSGVLFDVTGTYYPKVWSVDEAFGEVHGETAVFLSATQHGPTLALRAGGRNVFGEYPFHEAAYLGGGDTVRGLLPQRYAGDAAVWGNAELRMLLARVNILVPTGLGVFALADRGRVFIDGEDGDRWHQAYGGGVFAVFLRPENTLSLAVAREEGSNTTRLYVRGGFAF
jgi:hypothetical protein